MMPDGVESLSENVETLCGAALAGYKGPKEAHSIAFEDFPRSTTGKILRHDMEARLVANGDKGAK